MGNWNAKDRLIDKYSSTLTEVANNSIDWNNVNDNFEVDFDFDDYLKDFAYELETLIIDDIKERINNIL